MDALIDELKKYREALPAGQAVALSDDIIDRIHNVYPFNKFEYLISHLIGLGVLSLAEYAELRADYIERNRYLYLFELAPRTFGQEWGERHLMELIPDFKIPRTSLDSGFVGEYDLWLDGVRIEVKASRVVRKIAGNSLAEKAMAFGDDGRFDMNFQQLKPGCCDIFIWIAVWRNRIDYWMLTAEDVRLHPQFSNQHRTSQVDADGLPLEGQIHITDSNYQDFEKYRVAPDKIRSCIAELDNLKKNP